MARNERKVSLAVIPNSKEDTPMNSSAKQEFNGKKMVNDVQHTFSDYGTHTNPFGKTIKITLPSVWDRVAAGDSSVVKHGPWDNAPMAKHNTWDAVSDFAGEATKLSVAEPSGYGESEWGEMPDEQISRWENEGGN